MVTRNSTSAPRGNRRTSKGAPALVAVWPDATPRRVEFAASGLSILGSVPRLVGSLPTVRYDREILGERLDVDAAEKESTLEDIGNAAFAVLGTIKLIGKLMAGQDSAGVPLDEEDVSELGFSLHGLAHIAQELLQAAERIADAVPAARAIACG